MLRKHLVIGQFSLALFSMGHNTGSKLPERTETGLITGSDQTDFFLTEFFTNSLNLTLYVLTLKEGAHSLLSHYIKQMMKRIRQEPV